MSFSISEIRLLCSCSVSCDKSRSLISASFKRSLCFSSWMYAIDDLAVSSLDSLVPPPAFSTPFSTSNTANFSLTSSNSVSASSALSSATSLSNMAISKCSCASATRVSESWESCNESASSLLVAINSVCSELSLAWSFGRRATNNSASESRVSSSRTCRASSVRLASRTRTLARSS